MDQKSSQCADEKQREPCHGHTSLEEVVGGQIAKLEVIDYQEGVHIGERGERKTHSSRY